MTMLKAIILGCPGAGKSVFARKLKEATGLPLYYLDMLWHRPDRTHISRKEFDARLEAITRQERWIIDGNYSRTLTFRLERCDAAFLLDFPTQVCLAGAESRIGQKREDLPWIETEFDQEFRQWILDFPREQLPGIYTQLEKYQNAKKIIVFRSRSEAGDYLRRLSEG